MRSIALLVTFAAASGLLASEQSPPQTPGPATSAPASPAAPAADSSARATETPPAKQPFYLITDYLPLAIYDADSVTGCFRVENTTGTEATLDLIVKALDASGNSLEENTKQVVAPVTGFGNCQHTQDARKPAAIVFVLRKGTETLATVRVRLVRDADPWPETRIVNARMVAKDNGDVIVPVVHRLLKAQNRAFAPLKWILGDTEPTKQAKGGEAVAFVPGRWPLNLAEHNQAGQKWLSLGPFPADGSTPALRALDAITKTLAPAGGGAIANPPHVAVCLPPEDLAVATDPRVYRIIVDAILARLQQMGVKQIALVPPFQFGTPEKYWQRINSEVQESAAVYGAQAVDPAEFLNEKLWRVDPEVEGAYGAAPNPNGLKKIEQGLRDLLP